MSDFKVYVGNLPFSMSEEDLKNEFAACGEIEEVRVINDRETGRPKGFAFVTFATLEGMNAAIAKDGKELGGRNVRINKAEDKPRTGGGGGFGGGSGAPRSFDRPRGPRPGGPGAGNGGRRF